MVNFAYGSLPQAAEPPIDRLERDGLQMTWTGGDGSVWALNSRAGSGVYLLAGTRGLHTPTGTRFRDTSPAAHGSQHRGTIWHEREVFWQLKMWHGGTGPEFMERDRAFWETLDPDVPGIWEVGASVGAPRHLNLRLEPSTPDPGFDTLPSIRGWVNYGIYLTADQPFWAGEPSVRRWKSPTYVGPFFEENGPHLFNIGQGISLVNATISNNGDVESPPVWYIDGETLAGTTYVGIGSRRVVVPFSVPENRCLVIDSDPTRIGAIQYTVTSEGKTVNAAERIIGVHMINPVDRSRELGPADFAPIPPGSSVPLSLSLEGSGKIEVAVPSLYKRAW